MAVLYSLYRIAREDEGMVNATAATASAPEGTLDGMNTWQFYLNQAAVTAEAMWNHCNDPPNYNLCQFGLMVGSAHLLVLDALQQEAVVDPAGPWAKHFATIDANQRQRAGIWETNPFPYGSEFPFDTTGQEECFTTTVRYGGDAGYATSNKTLGAVKAYMSDIPHWAYAGSARRFWDFAVNGKIVIGPTERGLQHYGSGINSVVLATAYRMFPNETIALRSAYSASLGALAGIDLETGAPHMAFHADPSVLDWEPYAADFGVNMYGASVSWGCFVDQDTFGVGALVGYGCDVISAGGGSGSAVTLVPYDAARRRMYIGPLGLELELRSSAFGNATLDLQGKTLSVSFDHSFEPTSEKRMLGGDEDDASSASSASSADACPGYYSAVRLVVQVPAHPDWAKASNVTFVAPSPAPTLVRGAYELACDASGAVLKWE
jgi:hypothetical protein